MQTALPCRVRLLAVFLVLFAFAACHMAPPGAPDPSKAKRTSIAPPWTAEVLESHEYLYLELANGKQGILYQPQYQHDQAGDYLTSKNDPKVHLALSEVRVLDAIDPPQDNVGPAVQSVPGVLVAFWFAVFLFLPAIALYLILT